MIAPDKITEIRDRSSIVEVVSDYVTLKKAGRNYVGLCPFHSEKTPSFAVNEEKGIFHCFGCGVGGNVFHFLMQHGSLSFPEAVQQVGRRYGIVVEFSDRPGHERDREQRDGLYRVNERAAAYFHDTLFDRPEGRKALKYLQSRGVGEAAARRFYLGFSPSGSGLLGFLKREGFALKDAAQLGLVGERAGGHYGETFFDRLMFPIVDPGGKVVGFGGRVMGSGQPKYLNSAESPLFRKGATLYGLYQAKEAVRAQDRVVVVEGYLDALALSQAGVEYAVATLGTALTADHVRLLARYTKNVIVLFDGDEAGRKAAARSFEIFAEGGLLGRAAFLPEGEDPDTFVRAQGKQAVEALLQEAVPLVDYYLSWLERQHGRSLEGKSLIAREVSRVLAKVRNLLEKELLVSRAADFLGISEGVLRLASQEQPAKAGLGAVEASAAGREGKPDDLTERSLVGLMLRFPSVIPGVAEETGLERLVGRGWREIVAAILSQWKEQGHVDVASLTETLAAEQASQLAAALLEAEALAEDACVRMVADCVFHLKRRYLRELERKLRREIRAAEERKDEEAKKERMLKWQEVVKRGQQLERQKSACKTEIL